MVQLLSSHLIPIDRELERLKNIISTVECYKGDNQT